MLPVNFVPFAYAVFPERMSDALAVASDVSMPLLFDATLTFALAYCVTSYVPLLIMEIVPSGFIKPSGIDSPPSAVTIMSWSQNLPSVSRRTEVPP